MEVIFDPTKNAMNLRKHGLSLARAAEMDEDAAMFDVDFSQDYGEVRWNAIGWIDATLHTLTFSVPEEEGLLRAISLRRATKEEQRRYAKDF